MSVPAVKAAVELISTTVGTLPAKIFERGAEGGKTVASAHPAYALVHDDVNDWTSAGQLRTQLTADALLHGNGFAYAVRVGGRVRELILVNPFLLATNGMTRIHATRRVGGAVLQAARFRKLKMATA